MTEQLWNVHGRRRSTSNQHPRWVASWMCEGPTSHALYKLSTSLNYICKVRTAGLRAPPPAGEGRFFVVTFVYLHYLFDKHHLSSCVTLILESNRWCLLASQLHVCGVYDPLLFIAAAGELHPFLSRSISANHFTSDCKLWLYIKKYSFLLVHWFLFTCHQHEMFIFRTTHVNTVIVIILSTNVIQFYCVTMSLCCYLSMIYVSVSKLRHRVQVDMSRK